MASARSENGTRELGVDLHPPRGTVQVAASTMISSQRASEGLARAGRGDDQELQGERRRVARLTERNRRTNAGVSA